MNLNKLPHITRNKYTAIRKGAQFYRQRLAFESRVAVHSKFISCQVPLVMPIQAEDVQIMQAIEVTEMAIAISGPGKNKLFLQNKVHDLRQKLNARLQQRSH
ncbi:MAG: hypothetical protein HRU20_04555 [Pseudomonadales bacterium]|nr:hypothetical protein [Pseudomonadales bacterium]